MSKAIRGRATQRQTDSGRGLTVLFAGSKHPLLNLWTARFVAVVAILAAIWLLQEGEGGPWGDGSGKAAAYDLAGKPVTSTSGLESGPRIGKAAPDFMSQDLQGNTWRLSALEGKVVILNFWATWCPPCRAEMPELDALHQKYKDQDVLVLGLNLREDFSKVQRFSNVLNLTFPILLDPRGVVVAQYDIVALPTTFFIGRDGVIKDINIGALSDKALEAKLRKAME